MRENSKEPVNELGKKVREIRKNASLNQDEFGKQLGKSCKTISNYETGHNPIPDSTLNKISNLFSFPLGELLSLKKQVKSSNTTTPENESTKIDEPLKAEIDQPLKDDNDEMIVEKLKNTPIHLLEKVLSDKISSKRDNTLKITSEHFQIKLRELQNEWYLQPSKSNFTNYKFHKFHIYDNIGEYKINNKIGVILTTPTITLASTDIIEKVLGSATVIFLEKTLDIYPNMNIIYVWLNPIISFKEQFEILTDNFKSFNILSFQNYHLKTYYQLHKNK